MRNIETGVISDDNANCERVVKFGSDVLQKMTGRTFGEIVLKKADQAKTFAIMKKTIKFENTVSMSLTELFQQLVSIVTTQGPPDASILT